MKNVLFVILLFICNIVLANSKNHITGDKIHFQKDAIWISAYHNKSLCLNKNMFKVTVSKCIKQTTEDFEGEIKCLKYSNIDLTQPLFSSKKICLEVSENFEDKISCTKWGEAPYIQSPSMTIKFWEEDSEGKIGYYGSEVLLIPSCI